MMDRAKFPSASRLPPSKSGTITPRSQTYLGVNSGTLHFVKELANFFQVCKMGAVRVQSALALGTRRERLNEHLFDTARVDLERELICNWVLPQL